MHDVYDNLDLMFIVMRMFIRQDANPPWLLDTSKQGILKKAGSLDLYQDVFLDLF